ncbi:MAG: hypothetical protein WA110_06215 [Anaerolineaceae bacterium]
MNKAVFESLVFGPRGEPLQVDYVGGEVFYVLDDDGFMFHIPAEGVDRQVWEAMTAQISGNEEMLSEQAAKMLGQEDIFTVAVIRNQLENKEKQFEALRLSGLPEDGRAYLGMMGFRVTVDHHGEVLDIHQPGIVDEGGEN